jgi:hypothetical protein
LTVPVAVLGTTQIDWRQFIEIAEKATGTSPTRGLDTALTPKHSDPAAFLACIDLENQPTHALQTGRLKGHFRHYFVSFITVLDDETIRVLNQITGVSILPYELRRGQSLAILSGTMDEWYEAVYSGCHEERSIEVRELMNVIYNLFMNMGFKPSFPKKNKTLRDGTFTL